MRKSRLFMLVATITSMGVGAPPFVMAEEKALKKALADKKALEEKVEDLDRKVRLLEQRLEQVLGTAGGAKTAVSPAAKTEQVEALDQKVRILERRWELDQEQADGQGQRCSCFHGGKRGLLTEIRGRQLSVTHPRLSPGRRSVLR